jgi:RNA polymerase sigma-70 factor, ECF subfamily
MEATGRRGESMLKTEILEKLRERIVRYAASHSQGSWESGQDLAQEVLMVLHEKYAELDRVEDLLPLSLEIARLKLWAARRKSSRRGENHAVNVDDIALPSRDPDPYEQASRRETLARLESALAELGERCRELYRLKLQGYSFAEIQALLKVPSVNTLYTWDFRCRKQLLEKLGGNWEAPQRSEKNRRSYTKE